MPPDISESADETILMSVEDAGLATVQSPPDTSESADEPMPIATEDASLAIVKTPTRPARGYHKFRSGLLNVTPKGAEKAIVGRNQSTPLLSLPAEIRGRIWAYAVGGATLRPRATSSYAYDDKRRLKRWPADSPHGLALLSVCRQIYSEAAFLPSKLGILLLDNIEISWLTHARSAISQLKPYQRRQIKNVQFALLGITDVSPFRVQQMITETIWPGTRKLPSVEEIRVVIYSLCDEKPLPNETIHVDKPLILGGREIRVVIQTLDTPWMESDGEHDFGRNKAGKLHTRRKV